MSHDLRLAPLLQAIEPRVRLVPERYLRQVAQILADKGRPLPANPRLPFWIDRGDLVEEEVLPEAMLSGTESPLLLVTDPVDRLISDRPEPEQLLAYWRVLFQAGVMREIDFKVQSGALTEEECRKRLAQLDPHVAREIRFVLNSEHDLSLDADDCELYRMFAAVYLDLAVFDRTRIALFFPSLPEGDEVDLLLARDVNAQAIRTISRPYGSAMPLQEVPPDIAWLEHGQAAEVVPAVPPPERVGLREKAQSAEKAGNRIRAAILYTQLNTTASGSDQDSFLDKAAAELGQVVGELGELFHWDAGMRQEWKQALVPLLGPAAVGVWPRAARCLYELQTIAVDLTRDVYAVDLPEYIRTLGSRPVKRLLPLARRVQVLVRLKKAHAQMLRAKLLPAEQLRLDQLLHRQMHAIDHELREEIGPIIAASFARAGLVPGTTVERVGQHKAVSELLDRICERGYLRLGDLRDAIARNRLKLPDLAGPGEFVFGNALLRIDSDLPYVLDGVYQRGEFYLRWIQRGSALFFSTPIGRLITIYLFIPFGGAFLALMFAEEIRHLGGKLGAALSRPALKAAAASPPPAPAAQEIPTTGVVHVDQVDVDDTGQVVWDQRRVSSDDIDLTDSGELELVANGVLWIDTPAGSSLARLVLTSSANAPPSTEAHEKPSVLIAWPTILGFGIFLLLMFHVPVFRRMVFKLLFVLWLGLRSVLWDWPRSVWQSTAVRGLRQSLPVRFMVRHFWSPFLISLLLFLFLFVFGVSPWFLLRWGVWIWAGLTLAYNTPWGWVIQDRITEAISDWWRVVRTNLIPGFIGTFIDWFQRLANWIERKLYAVDEWLRFRGGDSQGSLALKAVLGLLWFPIAYAFRFAFYLLLEPQINPLKHFPVVTVSHKVMWPLAPSIASTLGIPELTVLVIVCVIPGIFGFIAWELKENWRLFKANLPPRLKPVMIGSHGETMRGLLRPGFHSGTVPKLYRKCRHAARTRLDWLRHDLAHVEECVEEFVDRELIDLLRQCPAWSNVALRVESIHFGAQRIAIDLAAPGLGADPFVFAFENVNGNIEATTEQTGWVDKLTGDQHAAFVEAFRGLLDMAAAAAVNGRPRGEASPNDPGFDELTRTVTWTEWVERWR